MATILNQAKETLKTCRKVKKEAENMYVYKNDKRAMRDITTAENVKDAASEAMGKIELSMHFLKYCSGTLYTGTIILTNGSIILSTSHPI